MVECLVGWGADVNAVDSIGSTPSHLAFAAKGFSFGDSPHLRKVVSGRVLCVVQH